MTEPNTGCWIWTASLFENGTGRFTASASKHVRSHEHLYRTLICEDITRPVFQKCGDRSCCNPDHLYVGKALSREDRRAYAREWQRKAVAERPWYASGRREAGRRSYYKHIEKRRSETREYQRRNRERTRAQEILKKYGITAADVAAMASEQDGRCRICRVQFGKTTQTKMCVDHCHGTGVVRGLLCTLCNLGIGNFRDDKHLLVAAAEYLGTGKVG